MKRFREVMSSPEQVDSHLFVIFLVSTAAGLSLVSISRLFSSIGSTVRKPFERTESKSMRKPLPRIWGSCGIGYYD